MADLLRQLIELTELDAEAARTREQIARYPAMLAKLDAEAREAADQAARLEGDWQAARRERVQAEKELAAIKDKIARLTTQQATIKTNKEYQAMLAEIGQLRAQADQWETRGLEALLREEAAEAQWRAQRERQAALQREHDAERARIEAQLADKRSRLERLEAERARRMAQLPESWPEEYMLLNERYPGSACARIEGDSCGGCHWKLVAQTLHQARAHGEIVRCEHCRRVLYWVGADG